MENPLYPIFLKTTELKILVVGGGYVALEKLTFLYKSSPQSEVNLVSPMLRKETKEFIENKNCHYHNKEYDSTDIEGFHLVIATTDNKEVNKKVYADCRSKNILVNVADNPPLCDFYMGGIVTKGNLKIAISTNGKSPTFAKRMREWLEDFLPEQTNEILNKLYIYRSKLKGDFEQKLNAMNEATTKMIDDHDKN